MDFTPTDVHLLTGFLFVASRKTATTTKVVLGERLLDSTTGEKRDMDIVVAANDTHFLAGVEVKAHKSALDAPEVEALIPKFYDMKEIGCRGIVSTSGFSPNAVKKAAAYGIGLYRFVRGIPPAFQTVDLSQLQALVTQERDWPERNVTLNADLSPEEALVVNGTTLALWPQGGAAEISLTMKEVADRVVAHVSSMWEGPGPDETAEAPRPFRVEVEFDVPPQIVLATRRVPISSAVVTGTATWRTTAHDVTESACYLEDGEGQPLAATVVVLTGCGLLGVASSTTNQELRTFVIPTFVRSKRPFKVTVFDH